MGNQSLQVLARQACGKIGIKILPRAAARSRLRFDSAAGPPSRRMAHKILLNYLPQCGVEIDLLLRLAAGDAFASTGAG